MFYNILEQTNTIMMEIVKIVITTGDPLTAVPNGIYDSSSYLSLLI